MKPIDIPETLGKAIGAIRQAESEFRKGAGEDAWRSCGWAIGQLQYVQEQLPKPKGKNNARAA